MSHNKSARNLAALAGVLVLALAGTALIAKGPAPAAACGPGRRRT
jgi:hypothetical protein